MEIGITYIHLRLLMSFEVFSDDGSLQSIVPIRLPFAALFALLLYWDLGARS